MRSIHLILHLALLATATAPAWSETINLEIDYMQDATHSHMPRPAEIAALVQMFACHGHTLNVVVDDALTEVANLQCPDTDDPFFSCSGSGTWREIKAANFDMGSGWHYCVFGHGYNGTSSSGLAEVGGNDLLVTIRSGPNNNGSPFSRASTLAHELGHNLGLRHFGQNSSGNVGNFQPNYASVMSYQYQFPGVRSQMQCLGLVDDVSLFKDLDYSHGLLPDLSESALNEAIGVGIHNVDWDCDLSLDVGSVSQDLDNGRPWCGMAGSSNVLRDYDDWGNIDDNAKSPTFDPDREFEVSICMPDPWLSPKKDLDDANLCVSSSPTLATEACRAGQMVWVDANYGGTEEGTGPEPYSDLLEASNASALGSILYLQPASYRNGGQVILLDRPGTLAGPGTAVIYP